MFREGFLAEISEWGLWSHDLGSLMELQRAVLPVN